MLKEDLSALIEKAKKEKDQRAFSLIYKEFNPLVRRLVKNVFKEDDEADDISAEIITKVLQNIDKYKKDVSFELWVKKVTNNTIIDKIRAGYLDKKEVSIDVIGLENFHYTDFSNPESTLINKQTRTQIEDVIDNMSKSSRNVMDLRYRDGLTYEKIAKRLNISVGTVKATISRQKKKIIKSIENEKNVSNIEGNSKAVGSH